MIAPWLDNARTFWSSAWAWKASPSLCVHYISSALSYLRKSLKRSAFSISYRHPSVARTGGHYPTLVKLMEIGSWRYVKGGDLGLLTNLNGNGLWTGYQQPALKTIGKSFICECPLNKGYRLKGYTFTRIIWIGAWAGVWMTYLRVIQHLDINRKDFTWSSLLACSDNHKPSGEESFFWIYLYLNTAVRSPLGCGNGHYFNVYAISFMTLSLIITFSPSMAYMHASQYPTVTQAQNVIQNLPARIRVLSSCLSRKMS